MTDAKLSAIEEIKQFIFAGNATFTVENTETGNRFTYKVTTPKGDKAGEVYFVNLLSGPDNTSDYTYMGIVNKAKTYFKTTAKSKVSPSAVSAMGFSWLVDMTKNGMALPEKVEFHHAGRCGRCGRKLTTPESIKAGFGPECITKIF